MSQYLEQCYGPDRGPLAFAPARIGWWEGARVRALHRPFVPQPPQCSNLTGRHHGERPPEPSGQLVAHPRNYAKIVDTFAPEISLACALNPLSFLAAEGAGLAVLQVEHIAAVHAADHPFAQLRKIGDLDLAIFSTHKVDEILWARVAQMMGH